MSTYTYIHTYIQEDRQTKIKHIHWCPKSHITDATSLSFLVK